MVFVFHSFIHGVVVVHLLIQPAVCYPSKSLNIEVHFHFMSSSVSLRRCRAAIASMCACSIFGYNTFKIEPFTELIPSIGMPILTANDEGRCEYEEKVSNNKHIEALNLPILIALRCECVYVNNQMVGRITYI